MGWNINSSEEKMISEINITSLADVMLVLLIIFMVTTPLIMIESFKVRLPKAITSTPEPGSSVTIAVSEAGRIELNGKAVSMDGLHERLASEFAGSTEKSVVLRADGATRHNIVVRVLDIARLAGAERLSIATEPEKDEVRGR
jgi:biopolymer transport protein ExbD